MLPPSLLNAAKPDAAGVAKSADAPTAKQEAAGVSYQFPSAPSSFIFRDGRRVTAHDGIYTTSREDEIAELEETVACGNIWHVGEVNVSGSFAEPVAGDDRTIK